MFSSDNNRYIFDNEISNNFDELQEISQWASQVIDYSSSYGADNSISYSAINICNRPSKWPMYGDFAETYHMLNYGPSSDIEISMKDQNKLMTFHDFIIVKFEHFVLPKTIKIYETYNPGSIIRILSYCQIARRWKVLYESTPILTERKAREFCPEIYKIDTPTRIIRIEFNHSLLDYYTGIDAVLLTGTKCIPSRRFESPDKQKLAKGIIQQTLETVDFRTQVSPSEAIEDFLRNDLNKFIEKIGLSTSPNDNPSMIMRRRKYTKVSDLPYEVLFKIFSYLDLKSLYNVSGVCKSFRSIVIDPLLYQEVNLKFHWHLADSSLMDTLTKRCNLIRKLDMSSCGYFGSMISNDFIKFIEQNGKMITTLRLNSSRFLNTSCLEAISRYCKNLTELSLRNYSSVTSERDFSSLLQLRNLEILDLSRSGIDSANLLEILRNNTKVHTLKIAFASLHINMDDVCMIISVFNPRIRSVDMWKSYSMSNRGLRALSECPYLEEINLGWTLRFDQEATLTESLKLIVRNCQNLKKLILAAVRGVTERDLENIATYGTNLEHLDLMGIVGVSSQMCQRILESCKKMRLLDISFCENIDETSILRWRIDFDSCKIQRSEVPNS